MVKVARKPLELKFSRNLVFYVLPKFNFSSFNGVFVGVFCKNFIVITYF